MLHSAESFFRRAAGGESRKIPSSLYASNRSTFPPHQTHLPALLSLTIRLKVLDRLEKDQRQVRSVRMKGEARLRLLIHSK
jgi:hypothetical protein